MDEYRNHTSSWNNYFTAWAYASTYIANEEESAVTSDERRITFHVRWCSELSKVTSNGYRILFRGDVYNILSVDLMNYQKREIRFSCRNRYQNLDITYHCGIVKDLRTNFDAFNARLLSEPGYHSQVFGCGSLELLDLGLITEIGAPISSSSSWAKLATLILRNETVVVTPYSTTVFYSGSPLGKGEGKILVPRGMVASYKADSTWGAYAAEIYAIEDYPELAE